MIFEISSALISIFLCGQTLADFLQLGGEARVVHRAAYARDDAAKNSLVDVCVHGHTLAGQRSEAALNRVDALRCERLSAGKLRADDVLPGHDQIVIDGHEVWIQSDAVTLCEEHEQLSHDR